MLTHSQISDTIKNYMDITSTLMIYVDNIIKSNYKGPSNIFKRIPSIRYNMTILGVSVANTFISVKISYTVTSSKTVPVYSQEYGDFGDELVIDSDVIEEVFSIPLYLAALTIDEVKDRAKVQIEDWKSQDEKSIKAAKIKKLEDELAALRK